MQKSEYTQNTQNIQKRIEDGNVRSSIYPASCLFSIRSRLRSKIGHLKGLKSVWAN
jgi:hypothetical protein